MIRKENFLVVSMILILLLLACGCGKEEAGTDTQQESSEQSSVSPELLLDNFLSDDGMLDLSELNSWNPDCIGWLVIENTDLSFPILSVEAGDTRYSNHNFFGEEDDKGSVYMEDLNAPDFSDYNTVIYGRNVAERFGGLHSYREKEFFETHRDISVYLGDRILKYRIFAAYTYDDRHLMYSFDFTDRNIYSVYLGEVLSQREMDAFVDNSDDITAMDRIITLSTGVTDQPEKRYLVQAVQIAEQPASEGEASGHE